MTKWWMLVMLLAACSKDAGGAAGGAAAAQEDVLGRLEAWTAPGKPEETYDKIQKILALAEAAKKAGQPPPPGARSAKPVPPTRVDTFASDVRLLAFYDLGIAKLDKATITPAVVEQVIVLYAKLPQSELRGLRPIAHKTFVESLDAGERTRLAAQLVAHVQKTGFLGDDAIGDDPVPPRSAAASAALGGGAAPTTTPPTMPTGVPLFAGIYKTTEGDALLVQTAATPTKVQGAYIGRVKGKLECTAEGPTLLCSWAEPGTSGGHATFTRSDDGNMKGSWGWGAKTSGGGRWNWRLVEAGKLE